MRKKTPRQASVSVTYQKAMKAGGTGKRPASAMAVYNEGFSYTDTASGAKAPAAAVGGRSITKAFLTRIRHQGKAIP